MSEPSASLAWSSNSLRGLSDSDHKVLSTCILPTPRRCLQKVLNSGCDAGEPVDLAAATGRLGSCNLIRGPGPRRDTAHTCRAARRMPGTRSLGPSDLTAEFWAKALAKVVGKVTTIPVVTLTLAGSEIPQ